MSQASKRKIDLSTDFEKALEEAGDCGLYHLWLMFLIALPYILVGSHMGASVFQAMTPKYFCDDYYSTWIEKNCNMTGSGEKHVNLLNRDKTPSSECYSLKLDFGNTSVEETCYFVTRNNSGTINSTLPEFPHVHCNSWVYDRSVMHSTIVTEFTLVCGDTWRSYISQSTFMFGVLLGTLGSGAISDRFGRRTAFLLSGIGSLIFGVATAFTQSYAMYILMRCLCGLFVYTMFPILFILVSEIIVVRHRASLAQFAEVSFAIGLMLLALLAYFTRDWRSLQLAISVPCSVSIFLWWVLPESPRWLIANDKHRQAEEVILKMKSVNKSECHHSIKIVSIENTTVEEEVPMQTAEDGPAEDGLQQVVTLKLEQQSVMDLFKHKNIRRVTIVMFYQWFAVSCVYYALTLNAAELGGNPFTNLFLNALAETVAACLVIPLVNKCGRQLCSSISEIMAGVFCLVLSNLPNDHTALLVFFSILGKFSIAISFSTMYIQVCEVYPTQIRSRATGACSAWARVGGIASPLIAMLTMLVPSLPYVIFSIMSVVSGILTLMIPETNNRPLLGTIKEAEAFAAANPGPLLNYFQRRKVSKKRSLAKCSKSPDAPVERFAEHIG